MDSSLGFWLCVCGWDFSELHTYTFSNAVGSRENSEFSLEKK